MENKYWNLFEKSGKVGDYLAFCKVRNAQNAALSLNGNKAYEENDQRSYIERTEYRGAR